MMPGPGPGGCWSAARATTCLAVGLILAACAGTDGRQWVPDAALSSPPTTVSPSAASSGADAPAVVASTVPPPATNASKPTPLPGGAPAVGGAARAPFASSGAAAPGTPAPLAAAPRVPRGPIAERSIDLNGACAQTDEGGFREQARLLVRNNEVRLLAWQLWVGRKGGCRFDQADFTQTRSRPHIELLARDGSGCKLMVWHDPRRITLAHAGCQKSCSGGIYEQAWPVMFDPVSGACANTDR